MWSNRAVAVERSSGCTVAFDVSGSVSPGGERREEGRFSGTVIALRCYPGVDRGTITRASAWLLFDAVYTLLEDRSCLGVCAVLGGFCYTSCSRS